MTTIDVAHLATLTLVEASPSQYPPDTLSKTEPWCSGVIKSWVLVPRDNTGTLSILSSCQTYRRKSVYRTPGGDVTPCESYGIAAVSTPEEHRRRGYATHMLRLLHYVLAPLDVLPRFPAEWGSPPDTGPRDAQFSVLFSGIGDAFYSACTMGLGDESKPGWVLHQTDTRVWKVPTEKVSPGEEWEWFDINSLGELEGDLSEIIRRNLGNKDKTAVAILPDTEFHIQAVRQVLWNPKLNDTFGLRLPQGEFIAYSCSRPEPDFPLRLVLMFASHPSPFDAVVAAAQREGAECIELWGPFEGWDNEAEGVDNDPMWTMPCIASYGGDVDWQYCDKYTWC